MRSKKSLWQYSLPTLLAVVAVAAFASHWFAAKRRASKAESEYLYIREGFKMGVNTKEELYRTSVEWLNAELAIPFFRRSGAYCGHLERMTELEDWHRGQSKMAMSKGDIEQYDQEASEAAKWRQEAETWMKSNTH